MKDSLKELVELMREIPSTYYPIGVIKGKKYYYMCKEDVANTILKGYIKKPTVSLSTIRRITTQREDELKQLGWIKIDDVISMLGEKKTYIDDIEDCNCELCIAERSNTVGHNQLHSLMTKRLEDLKK